MDETLTEIPATLRAKWQLPSYEVAEWNGRTSRWCVVIPVINEGQSIVSLLQQMTQLRISEMADIVIVDGGSTDGSLAKSVLQQHAVRGLLIKTGPGKLSAQLRCAYAHALEAGYQGIITIDGNNKDDPEAIPQFVAALENGTDFVQASRYIPGGRAENTPLARALAIRFVHAPLLSLFSGFHWTDTTQGFRAYHRRVLLDERVAPFRGLFQKYELLAYLSYRIPRLGYHCAELPTCRRYPAGAVPTKIRGMADKMDLLQTLLSACLGRFNP